MIKLDHGDMENAALLLADKIKRDFINETKILKVYPVPRGGVACAYLTASYLPTIEFVNDVAIADIAIDDVIDSGPTKKKIISRNQNIKFYAFYENPPEWLVFPFECTLDDKDSSIDDAITRILEFKGLLGKMDFEKAKECVLNAF